MGDRHPLENAIALSKQPLTALWQLLPATLVSKYFINQMNSPIWHCFSDQNGFWFIADELGVKMMSCGVARDRQNAAESVTNWLNGCEMTGQWWVENRIGDYVLCSSLGACIVPHSASENREEYQSFNQFMPKIFGLNFETRNS